LGRTEGQDGLGHARSAGVVIGEGHGLGTGVHVVPLCVRGIGVADRGAGPIARGRGHAAILGPAVAVPVAPGEEDPAALVIVGLEVVHDLENRGREGPDVALPGLRQGGVVDLVDPPVVCLAVLRAQGGQGHPVVRHGGGQGQGVGVCAQVDLMPDCVPSGPPVQGRADVHARGSVGRLRGTGVRRAGEEPDLAEAALRAPAPGAQAGQLHVLGHCAA